MKSTLYDRYKVYEINQTPFFGCDSESQVVISLTGLTQ